MQLRHPQAGLYPAEKRAVRRRPWELPEQPCTLRRTRTRHHNGHLTAPLHQLSQRRARRVSGQVGAAAEVSDSVLRATFLPVGRPVGRRVVGLVLVRKGTGLVHLVAKRTARQASEEWILRTLHAHTQLIGVGEVNGSYVKPSFIAESHKFTASPPQKCSQRKRVVNRTGMERAYSILDLSFYHKW